jgi:hypothetical protein
VQTLDFDQVDTVEEAVHRKQNFDKFPESASMFWANGNVGYNENSFCGF